MDANAAAAAAAATATGTSTGSRKRTRAEPPPSPNPSMAAAAAATSSAALAAAVAAAANYMPTQQQQLAQMQQMQQLMPLGLGGSEITLRLTKVQGKTVLHGDPVMIYRVELSRNGVFEKYLFLPNDAIPIYGVRSWQHRDAIPQELLKMVSGGSSKQSCWLQPQQQQQEQPLQQLDDCVCWLCTAPTHCIALGCEQARVALVA